MTRNVAIKQLWVCQSSVSMASGPSHLAHFSCAAVTRCCCLPSRLQGDCGGSSHRIQTPASSTKSRLLACILFVRKALPGSPSVPSSDTATCACRNQSPAGTQACHVCLRAAPQSPGWGGAAALPLRPLPPSFHRGGGRWGVALSQPLARHLGRWPARASCLLCSFRRARRLVSPGSGHRQCGCCVWKRFAGSSLCPRGRSRQRESQSFVRQTCVLFTGWGGFRL